MGLLLLPLALVFIAVALASLVRGIKGMLADTRGLPHRWRRHAAVLLLVPSLAALRCGP